MDLGSKANASGVGFPSATATCRHNFVTHQVEEDKGKKRSVASSFIL